MTEFPALASHCPWTPLDAVHQIYLGVSLIILGILGVAANSWLASTFLMSPFFSVKTYLLILNLTIACLGRGLLAGFPFAGTSTLAGRWLFGHECCQYFAFLQQFFGMSQVATVTMLAVERVLIVRRLHSGSYLSLQQYVTGILLCWIAAATWAMPPLLSWGRCVCVWCSVSSVGRNFSPSAGRDMDHTSQHSLTKTVGVLVPGLYLMWLPQSLLALWTLTGIPLPAALIVLASISSEASAIVPLLTCLICDLKMRRALIGILHLRLEIKEEK